MSPFKSDQRCKRCGQGWHSTPDKCPAKRATVSDVMELVTSGTVAGLNLRQLTKCWRRLTLMKT